MFTTKNRVLLCFFLFLTLFNLFSLVSSQEENDVQFPFCIKKGDDPPSASYRKNLETIAVSLAQNTNQSGYYVSSAGRGSDKVNAMVLCRGDFSDIKTCRNCIQRVANRLKNECLDFKEAFQGSDRCLLFYTNNNSLSGFMENPTKSMVNPSENVSDVDRFNQGMMTLLNDLRGNATSGGNNLQKYAQGTKYLEGYLTVYAFVQCTPVLSEKQCNDCLAGAIGEIFVCCNKRAGGRVLKPSCNLRYEKDAFILPHQSNIANPPPPPGKKSKKTKIVVIGVVSSISSLIAIAVVVFICIILKPKMRKQKIALQRYHFEEVSTSDDLSFEKSLQYDFATIITATDNFSDANKLGQGGFGSVYKGVLPSGEEIAVKRLSQGSGQGESEFKNEVLLVAKLQHRNLVRLVGFCIQGVERILIYEFISNASLDHFLFDPMKRASLDWNTRYRIIQGIARGLLYLHEDSRLRIIHRDIKASNILLDKDMVPKVSDFGLARLFGFDETQGNTNRIAGTYGYMAPEYAMHGNFSVKSDAYSFGVLVLEIVSGEKNNSFRQGDEDGEQDLLTYAWKHWQEKTVVDLVDPALRESDTGPNIRDITKCIQIGLLCVQDRVSARPTMASVVAMLNNFSISTLSVPTKPAFCISPWSSSTADFSNANVKSFGQSINKVTVTELSPR